MKPEFQNKHIGSRLLEECFKIAKSKGMETIQLEVLKTNSLAIRFYKRHSFSFLYEKGEESYIYQKNLGAGRRIMDSRKLDEKNIPEIIRGGGISQQEEGPWHLLCRRLWPFDNGACKGSQ